MDDSKLVRKKLKGFRKEWTPFFKGIMEREKILDWSRMWDDFVLEELQDEDLNGGQYKNNDENVSLVSQEKKGKFKKFSNGEYASQNDKKKGTSKVKCYACHNFGHYAGQCPNKKKGGNEAQPEVATWSKALADEFAKKFEHTKLLLIS
jgi:hypothetical protein